VAPGGAGGDGAAVAARAAQIAELLECHPATVRRWIGRFNTEGLAGLADRPGAGGPGWTDAG
jgi:transposase